MRPVHETLHLWRLERNFTQAELARASGVPRPNLSRMESGARDLTVATLRRLARALGIPPGILADGIPPVNFQSEKWSRGALDRIARFLAGESVELSDKERQAAESVRPLVRQKIRALTRKDFLLRERGRRRIRSHWKLSKIFFEPAEIQSLLARIDKLAGRFA